MFIDKMHFYYKKINNGKVTQPESEKHELLVWFINTHSSAFLVYPPTPTHPKTLHIYLHSVCPSAATSAHNRTI